MQTIQRMALGLLITGGLMGAAAQAQTAGTTDAATSIATGDQVSQVTPGLEHNPALFPADKPAKPDQQTSHQQPLVGSQEEKKLTQPTTDANDAETRNLFSTMSMVFIYSSVATLLMIGISAFLWYTRAGRRANTRV